MQFGGNTIPPVGLVIDTDLGNHIDDALALALLYGADGKREARVVSVSVSKPNLQAAAFCEVIGRFYAGTVSGAFGSFSRTLPVGLALKGKYPEATPMLTVPLSRKNDKGEPLYNHGIETITDTAECPALIRNAFTAQHDNNCIVVLLGPATNLAQTLALPDARGWIEKKVRYLVVSAGVFPGGGPEFNVQTDVAAAKKLFAEWPTPVYIAGREVGEAIPFPAESIERDFAWSTAHPVVDAYKAYKAMPYDAPAQDMAAALQAVRPDKNYFNLSEPGTLTVLDDGSTKFVPSANGKHRYLIADPAKKETVLQAYIELAAAKPVPRTFRRRPPMEEQEKKQEEPKKPEAKKEEPKATPR